MLLSCKKCGNLFDEGPEEIRKSEEVKRTPKSSRKKGQTPIPCPICGSEDLEVTVTGDRKNAFTHFGGGPVRGTDHAIGYANSDGSGGKVLVHRPRW